MSHSFDTIVIGSGFGGAVTACRLAEKGARVLVLERGRRWRVEDYPRDLDDAWVYDPECPEERNGWIDLRFLDDMIVAQGAGIGGGSLIYANVSVEAPEWIFEEGWPPEITCRELRPYYRRVGEMLGVEELPDNQLHPRFRLMREAAEKEGYGDRFRKLPVTVTFDPELDYDGSEPPDPERSREWENDLGQKRGRCVHLGNCMIGCEVRAKNTLEYNYVPLAEKHGAEFRELHLVRSIEPEGNGYRVRFDRIADGRLIPGSETAERVVLAAGSLGSTELLLRCRDQHKTLPAVSRRLGHGWSSNGDFLTPAFYDGRLLVPTRGPTITAAIDFLDGSFQDRRFFVEDGGFPDVLGNYLRARIAAGTSSRRYRKVLAELERTLDEKPALAHVMPWFAQGIDAANGRLYLGRKWLAPWRRVLKLDWEIDKSEELIDAIVAMHEKLAETTGGDPWVPPTWTILKNLATPHPLGGCNLGTTVENGVVDHRGQVFGYPNLYVADGAIVPEAIGRNPSRTIAALAERIAELT